MSHLSCRGAGKCGALRLESSLSSSGADGASAAAQMSAMTGTKLASPAQEQSGLRSGAAVHIVPCVQAAGKEEGFQELLAEIESAKLEGGALDSACAALQELVSSVMLKDKILEQACGSLHPPSKIPIFNRLCRLCIVHP